MTHHGNVTKINGAEVEPVPIRVTRYHFKEEHNGEIPRHIRSAVWTSHGH